VILNATCFGVLSFLLVLNVIPLFSALNTLQKGRMELTNGVKMLASVFAIFTFCYVTRTLYDILVAPTLGFWQIFSGVTLPLLWDFVPIFLMFNYHFRNLKILDKNNTKTKRVR
jgi:hypothetical protein